MGGNGCVWDLIYVFFRENCLVFSIESLFFFVVVFNFGIFVLFYFVKCTPRVLSEIILFAVFPREEEKHLNTSYDFFIN